MLDSSTKKATSKKTSEWWINAWIWLANYIFLSQAKGSLFFCSSKVWIKKKGKAHCVITIFFIIISKFRLYIIILSNTTLIWPMSFILFFCSNNFILREIYMDGIWTNNGFYYTFTFYFVLRTPDLENIWVYALAT